jgi:hypothetical protein
MAMNFAPLDCSCQGASSEPKKMYLDFSVLEKFAKNHKIHIFGRHSKKWVQWPELLLYLNSYTITHRNFVRIVDKHFFRKIHDPLPSIKFAPGGSSLIKHNMIMNYTPLDSSFQCAS